MAADFTLWGKDSSIAQEFLDTLGEQGSTHSQLWSADEGKRRTPRSLGRHWKSRLGLNINYNIKFKCLFKMF